MFSSNGWSTVALNDEQFAETFGAFAKRTDEYDIGTTMIINILRSSSVREVKWLAIGCASGYYERKILDTLSIELPDLSISLLKGFEPNPISFKALTANIININNKNVSNDNANIIKDNNNDNIKNDININKHSNNTSNVCEIELHNLPITGETKLEPKHYDLITVPHVLYYIDSTEERQGVLKNLFSALAPGGTLFVQHAQGGLWGKNGIEDNLIFDFSKKIDMHTEEEAAAAEHVQGDYSISVQVLQEEFLQANIKGMKVELRQFKTSVTLGLLDKEKNPDLIKILSFFLGCDVSKLCDTAVQEMLDWLLKNAEETALGNFCLSQPLAALIITRKSELL